MNRRFLVVGATLGALGFGACAVYDPADLTGGGQAGADDGSGGEATGGSSGSSGDGSGGVSGTATSGGTGGSDGGTSSASGGSAGDAPTGGKGGAPTGGAPTGGKSTGGTSTGGGSGSGSGGKGGSGGAAAGMAGAASGGTAGMGGAGAGGAAAGAGAGGATAGGGIGGAMAGASGAAGAGGSGGGIVVLLTGVASADTSESGHPPADAIDGVTSTRWCAVDGAVGHYWSIDLGAVHSLSRFEVMWEYPNQASGLAYGYVISTSSDGTTFTPVIDRSANVETIQTQSSNFPPATSSRYVRITVTLLPASTPRPTWASFWEARVYGQ